MTEGKMKEARALKEGYALFSPLTNLPYVECEEKEFNDQVFLYASKDDAENAADAYEEKGIRVTVKELKTVRMKVEKKQENIFLNQVRQHLSTLPFMGVNAVFYVSAGGEGASVELKELLPEGYEEKMRENQFYQPNLQLTGMYLMQEARRKKEYVDMKHLQELDEEFSSNLVKSRLFLAVLPPQGHEKDQQIDLKECKLPYLKHQNGDYFFPVFSDLWEFQKYTRGQKDLRPIQVPFPEITKFWVKDAKAYMLNPMGYSLPLTKEMVPRLLDKFGVSQTPS